MSGTTARQLIWVPIIHTQADLGSVSESVKTLYTRTVGPKKWNQHVATINELWNTICEEIQRLDLDYGKVRLYQDGLPKCGQELRIVKDMIEAGSRNHNLLMELVEKGAQLVGTESPELLLEEYELVRGALRSIAAGGKGTLNRREAQRSTEILKKRDCYIAERIDDTLKTGETGLLFLGMLHNLTGALPHDIRLSILSLSVSKHSKDAPKRREDRNP